MVRVTEVDGDAEELLEASVVLPQKIVVGGHGEPFRVALLDAQARPLHICDRDREYLFDERDAELPSLPESMKSDSASPTRSRRSMIRGRTSMNFRFDSCVTFFRFFRHFLFRFCCCL